MGFGFNLMFILVILPVTLILLFLWIISKREEILKILGVLWIGIISLIIFSIVFQFFTTKMNVDKSDIYGEYIIDRNKYSGEQSDWQYNNFRFEITKENKLIFHETNEKYIENSDTLNINILEKYRNNRIRIERKFTTHHVIEEEPTLYRNVWSFYYVFESPKFGNVFFKKGKWKKIEK